ncbi:hypothetical protein NDU88_000260 [Pleurodeles waltl]|uniref:Uncharacterized protein n=1 Tax=Pleurodeles waltl TaxID=8319 RepID=A0AAV7S907_PLEWA|nr:hypothetical protein NDU88_000260 [Pleurodeles waltl]
MCPGACFRAPRAPVQAADTSLPAVQQPLAPHAASAVGIPSAGSGLGSAAPRQERHRFTSVQVSSARRSLRRGVIYPAACRRPQQASAVSDVSGALSGADPPHAGSAPAL